MTDAPNILHINHKDKGYSTDFAILLVPEHILQTAHEYYYLFYIFYENCYDELCTK